MTLPNGASYKGSHKQQYMNSHYRRNRERLIADAKEYRRLMKKCVIEHYGNKCACCGESNIAFLQIDHIAENGNEHRRAIGRSSGIGFYTWLKKNNFPEGFQVLCCNCNLGKHWNGGVCPHQQEPT